MSGEQLNDAAEKVWTPIESGESNDCLDTLKVRLHPGWGAQRERERGGGTDGERERERMMERAMKWV